jgi:hypothetical protein
VKGLNYLTSLEYGKIGINSLDVAKVYVEYEELDIDYEQLIVKNFFNQENSFYYDYFRFLVLYIFINKLVISYNYEIAKDSIIEISEKIKRYFLRFSDNNEQVTNDDDS